MKIRAGLFPVLFLASALSLTGCGLNPKQLQALDGAMCNITEGYGVKSTTTIVAGASKSGGTMINGANCSIASESKPEGAAPKPESKS